MRRDTDSSKNSVRRNYYRYTYLSIYAFFIVIIHVFYFSNHFVLTVIYIILYIDLIVI